MKNKVKNRIKRLAADTLGVGIHRIKIVDIKEAEKKVATREDVRQLYKEGIIKIKPVKGTLSKRRKQELGKKRRRRNEGSRKGSKETRIRSKKSYMKKVRILRSYLKELVEKGLVEKDKKRMLYLKIKGNEFKSKSSFENYLRENGLLNVEKIEKS